MGCSRLILTGLPYWRRHEPRTRDPQSHGEELDPGVLALAPLLAEFATALEIRVVELVVGRLVRFGDVVHLFADHRETLADLLVAERLDLGFELVGLVYERLEVTELTVVGVDESGKESHGR